MTYRNCTNNIAHLLTGNTSVNIIVFAERRQSSIKVYSMESFHNRSRPKVKLLMHECDLMLRYLTDNHAKSILEKTRQSMYKVVQI
jgi:hypothetical protein